MSIIVNSSIIDIRLFLSEFNRAARGVVHVTVSWRGTMRAQNSGWLITDTLVVVPGFTLTWEGGGKGPQMVICRPSFEFEGEIEADLISPLPPNQLLPVLLRLRTPLPGRALRLATGSSKEGDRVFILHHPSGDLNQKLSIGTLLKIDSPNFLRYDAPTKTGSSGGPVLNENGEMIGMHVVGRVRNDEAPANEGLSLATILTALRRSEVWAEIAQYHHLADISAIHIELEKLAESLPPAPSDPALLYAAVHWSFDPKTLSQTGLEVLQALVINPDDAFWVLRSSERQRLLRLAGSLNALRAARGELVASDVRQQVIDAILQGPPYFLDKIEDRALPYWLQAVRWFSDWIPDLPTPQEITREIERRRVRSRLQEIAGPNFRGRTKELTTLKKWYTNPQSGPIIVSGIGGIGKSALVAQFVLNLSPGALLFWLDFDRADIAPDDAVSMLNLLSAQAVAQIEAFTAQKTDESSWEAGVSSFGQTLATQGAPVLLVLDSFEVAQNIPQYQEIWRLLELIFTPLPNLHILISGRAPVENLTLGGRESLALNLRGLARPVAEKWLREANIHDDAMRKWVLDIAHGVPLVLLLAARWVELGGKIQDLPEKFPKEMINGFLYQRILDRVIDPALKPIARDVLVLRWLTADMLESIASDSIPAALSALVVANANDQSDIHELFARLGRELALVSGNQEAAAQAHGPAVLFSESRGVLRLRPEVRTATLKLLELEDGAHVQLIERRAVEWFAGQDLSDPLNAAELVYHRLRLRDLKGAQAAWLEGCAPLLLDAVQELPEEARAERAWLRKYTRQVPALEKTIPAWETEATKRIQAAIGRGLTRAVPGILGEFSGRSSASPLVFYDAWQLWQSGNISASRILLDKAEKDEDPIGRDRSLLAALLAMQELDYATADRLLKPLVDEERWRGSVVEKYAVLAVQAARVLLTVDLRAELKIYDIIAKQLSNAPRFTVLADLKTFLTSYDVILQPLARLLEAESVMESMKIKAAIAIPDNAHDLPYFAMQIQQAYWESFHENPPRFISKSSGSGDAWQAKEWVEAFLEDDKGKNQAKYCLKLGEYLADLGEKRREIVTTSLFLSNACQQAQRGSAISDFPYFSISGALALFGSGSETSPDLIFQSLRLNDLLEKVMTDVIYSKWTDVSLGALAKAIENLDRYEKKNPYPGYNLIIPLEEMIDAYANLRPGEWHTLVPQKLLHNVKSKWLKFLFLHVISPNPLEALIQKMISPSDAQ